MEEREQRRANGRMGGYRIDDIQACKWPYKLHDLQRTSHHESQRHIRPGNQAKQLLCIERLCQVTCVGVHDNVAEVVQRALPLVNTHSLQQRSLLMGIREIELKCSAVMAMRQHHTSTYQQEHGKPVPCRDHSSAAIGRHCAARCRATTKLAREDATPISYTCHTLPSLPRSPPPFPATQSIPWRR